MLHKGVGQNGKKKVMDIGDLLVEVTLDDAEYREFQFNDFSKRNKKNGTHRE